MHAFRPGLLNRDQIYCYANALVLSYVHTAPIANYFYEETHSNWCKLDPDDCAICALQNIVKEIMDLAPEDDPLSGDSFHNSIESNTIRRARRLNYWTQN